MSSLAQQLQKLQIPAQLAGPATKTQKHKASLLFSGIEAADIDNETIFSLSKNGLEELQHIEPGFRTFEESLFNELSKKTERSVQTKEFNDRLDNQISHFLKLLSPYFLLKPSQKCLEWLIRRFRIHIINVDALMTCVLPYHETNLFARVVQLLKIRDSSAKWHWLLPLQKSGSPLARTTVLQRCTSDLSFMVQICEMVSDCLNIECPVSSLRVLLGFYASTIVGALEIVDKISEEIITRLLPYIIKGLKSDVSGYKGSSYMIIAQLCIKCTLDGKLVKSLLDNMCKHLGSELMNEGLLCVTAVCQTQCRKKLPRKAFKSLLKVKDISQHLCQLSAAHDITALLQALLPQLVTAAIKECIPCEGVITVEGPLISCLNTLLRELELESGMVKCVSRTMLEEYCNARNDLIHDKTSCEMFNNNLKVLPQFLEKRYPTELEKALEEYVEGLKSDNDEDTIMEHSQWTLQFMSLALSGFMSQVVPDSSATLILSLNHPKSDVRLMALKHLHQMLKDKKKESSRDADFLSTTLLARLADDEPAVACAVLDMDEILIKSAASGDLVDKLLELLNKTDTEWKEASEKVVSLLTGPDLTANSPALLDRVVFGLVPLLFLNLNSHKDAESLAKTMSQSAVAEQHPLLAGMKALVKNKDWKACAINSEPDVLAAGNTVLIRWLGDQLANMSMDKQLDMVSKFTTYSKANPTNLTFHLLVNCCLGRMLSLSSIDEEGLDLCEAVLGFLTESLEGIDKLKATQALPQDDSSSEQSAKGLVPLSLMSHYVSLLKRNKAKKTATARAAINLWLLGNFVRNMPIIKSVSKADWWSCEDEGSTQLKYTQILLSVFEVLASGSGSTSSVVHQDMFRQLLQEFIQLHLPNKLTLLKFLVYIWSNKTVPTTSALGFAALLQVQSLHIGSVCLRVLSDSDVKSVMNTANTVVASLLVSLCSPIQTIRKMAMACLKSLLSAASSPPPSPVGTFVALLVENGEELEADPDHLQRLFTLAFRALSSLESPASTKSPRGKTKKTSGHKILSAMLDYILNHAVDVSTPLYVQRSLMSVLSEIVTQDVLCSCLPRLRDLVTRSQTGESLSPDESYCLQYLIKKFNSVTAPLLESNPECFKLIKDILSLKTSLCHGHPSPAASLLDQISNAFFQAIPSKDKQQKVLSMLIDLLLKTKEVALTTKAKDILDKLEVHAEQVTEELSRLKLKPEAPKKKKIKRSVAAEDASSPEEAQSWQRITIILELLQHKKNVTHREQLVSTLFALLSRCVESDVPEQANCEYIKQLLLAEILNICQGIASKAGQDVLAENQFNVELVVQCIRVSENPQTHHHALLLLAAAAQLFPEKVLHNVMSIFTFMGANILRQDDSYSFQVISKTVDTVIPALIQAGEKQRLPKLQSKGAPPTSLDDIVAMVIRVFVDASPHVPEHRRLPVFSHLVATVGAERFLHTTAVLLMESFIVHSKETEDEEGKAYSPLDIEFCVSLCQEFDPSVQAEAMLNLLRYVAKLPTEKPEGHHRPRTSRKSAPLFSGPAPLFDIHTHSAKHLRQFKFTALGLIPTVLSSEVFTTKLPEQDENSNKRMDNLYVGFVEELLKFITTTAQYTENKAQDATKKFWRALLHKAYDVMDKVNQLLPIGVFIGVIRRLLHNDSATVRRKAMELLNTKLGHFTVTEEQEKQLLDLAGDLVTLVQSGKSGEETAVNRQTALYSLKLLARLLAEQHQETFTMVLDVTIKVFTHKDENVQVASNAILCLAEVCVGLKTSAIPYLPRFMPDLLKLLKQSEEQSNSLVLCAGVTLHKVIETLPHFLSPYLDDILMQVSSRTVRDTSDSTNEGEEVKGSAIETQIRDRLAVVRKDLARVITPRVLIPAVSQCYTKMLDTQRQDAIPLLLDVVTEAVTNMTMRDVTSHTDQLFKFLLIALDFRVTQSACNAGLVDRTEGKVIESFLCLVMKMSEATFRPVFLKLVDWATRANANKNRLLVFYRLCLSIADKLKGLMTLFAGYILKNCSSLLDANNTAKADQSFFEGKGTGEKSVQLVSYILDCLQKCLLYSSKGFIDKERFDCLMQPVVDQLENEAGDKEGFKERITGHVVPCLAQLAVASGSDVYWKPLNYQVLLKTRHTSSQVRFAALKALEELHHQLGEEFIVLLLPESIPFLAELMEDECFEVEQQCQHVVSEIEGVLGEPLQKYFEP